MDVHKQIAKRHDAQLCLCNIKSKIDSCVTTQLFYFIIQPSTLRDTCDSVRYTCNIHVVLPTVFCEYLGDEDQAAVKCQGRSVENVDFYSISWKFKLPATS